MTKREMGRSAPGVFFIPRPGAEEAGARKAPANVRVANRQAEDFRFGAAEDVSSDSRPLRTCGESAGLLPVATQRVNAWARQSEFSQFWRAGRREKFRALISVQVPGPRGDQVSPHILCRSCGVDG